MIHDLDFDKLIFHHHSPIQVRFSDIDMMNHVNNSIQTTYCDVARMQYFNDVFNLSVARTEQSLIVASLHVDFKKPIFMKESIWVLNKIVEIGHKSITMAQQIITDDNKEIKSRAITVLTGYNHLLLKSIVIPEKWQADIENFEGTVIFKYPKK